MTKCSKQADRQCSEQIWSQFWRLWHDQILDLSSCSLDFIERGAEGLRNLPIDILENILCRACKLQLGERGSPLRQIRVCFPECLVNGRVGDGRVLRRQSQKSNS